MFCKQVDVIKVAYHQKESIEYGEKNHEDDNKEESISPRDVGHNIYILAHQVSHHTDDMRIDFKFQNILVSPSYTQYYLIVENVLKIWG